MAEHRFPALQEKYSATTFEVLVPIFKFANFTGSAYLDVLSRKKREFLEDLVLGVQPLVSLSQSGLEESLVLPTERVNPALGDFTVHLYNQSVESEYGKFHVFSNILCRCCERMV